MESAVWFPGVEPRNELESRFIDRLRERAASWDVPGLVPDQTWGLAAMIPLYVEVTVPGWQAHWSERLSLQVGYWSEASPSLGWCLEGAWGDAYLLDNHDPKDSDCLTVVGGD